MLTNPRTLDSYKRERCICKKCPNGKKDCVQYIHPDKLDSKKSVATCINGSFEYLAAPVHKFNSDVKKNYTEHERMRRDNVDIATQVIMMNYTDMVKDASVNPVTDEEYVEFARTVFKNMMDAFLDQCGIDIFNKICTTFERYSDGVSDIQPFFMPCWALFGRTSLATEEDIEEYKGLRFYCNNIVKGQRGFLQQVLDTFKDDEGNINEDLYVIFNIISPNGKWNRGNGGAWNRYSDIAVDLSSKGKVKKGETCFEGSIRETREEISMDISTYELKKGKCWGDVDFISCSVSAPLKYISPFANKQTRFEIAFCKPAGSTAAVSKYSSFLSEEHKENSPSVTREREPLAWRKKLDVREPAKTLAIRVQKVPDPDMVLKVPITDMVPSVPVPDMVPSVPVPSVPVPDMVLKVPVPDMVPSVPVPGVPVPGVPVPDMVPSVPVPSVPVPGIPVPDFRGQKTSKLPIGIKSSKKPAPKKPHGARYSDMLPTVAGPQPAFKKKELQ